jgi:hypothetical protein
MTVQPTEIRDRMERSHDNETALRIYLDHTPLPAPTTVRRPDAVFVLVADIDDFEPWLDTLGGMVHVGPVFEGACTWSLHTQLPARSDGTRVQVRVMATVVMGEAVLDRIRSAVAA